jgi:hypothetical protein
MKKIVKWGLIIFVGIPFGFLLIVGTIGNLIGGKDVSKTQTPTPTPTQAIVQQKGQPTPTPVKTISYEVLQQWDINNGGKGKIILIPADYLNEADMTTLGQKLKSDTKNDKNAFIMVFTDKKAAALRDKVTGNTMTKDEEKFYDTHYVGQYTKNGNSGFHAFAIYFDGVSGSNNKTINY